MGSEVDEAIGGFEKLSVEDGGTVRTGEQVEKNCQVGASLDDSKDLPAQLQPDASKNIALNENVEVNERNVSQVPVAGTLFAAQANKVGKFPRGLARHEFFSVVNQLAKSGSWSASIVPKLLDFFIEDIRRIFNTAHKNREASIIWKPWQRCWQEASDASGSLDFNRYLAGVAAKSPVALTTDSNEKDEQVWQEFWFELWETFEERPTLFQPPATDEIKATHYYDVPPYLFRVYDSRSSGKNTPDVIASVASNCPSPKREKDIFSLDNGSRAEKLYKHLFDKSFWGAHPQDNLMSWTISLLFAVQYAVYRWQRLKSSKSDIKICMIETKAFPRGQFMQDVFLLESLDSKSHEISERAREFFNFRLGDDTYYNGEFLSQGIVQLNKGVSTVSFEQLEEAGLLELFPEFKVFSSESAWTKRVKKLRDIWLPDSSVTSAELSNALDLANKCFPQMNRCHVACIFLTFKNRKFRQHNSSASALSSPQPRWADKPVEVNRYWQALQTYEADQASTANDPDTGATADEQHSAALRRIFPL